jgi:hypothetical protein
MHVGILFQSRCPGLMFYQLLFYLSLGFFECIGFFHTIPAAQRHPQIGLVLNLGAMTWEFSASEAGSQDSPAPLSVADTARPSLRAIQMAVQLGNRVGQSRSRSRSPPADLSDADASDGDRLSEDEGPRRYPAAWAIPPPFPPDLLGLDWCQRGLFESMLTNLAQQGMPNRAMTHADNTSGMAMQLWSFEADGLSEICT